ncbi:hypothetical protein [Paenibacillus sp. SI8]
MLIDKEEDIPEVYRKVPKEELLQECQLFGSRRYIERAEEF